MFVLRQPFENRPQGRAPNPLEHKVLTFENVKVGRLPGSDVETATPELVEIPPRLAHTGARQTAESISPVRTRAELLENCVRGFGVVGGHLECESTAPGQLR